MPPMTGTPTQAPSLHGPDHASVADASFDPGIDRRALTLLRLSGLLAAGYQIVYQYYVSGMAQAEIPALILTLWLVCEHLLWTLGVWRVTRPHFPPGVGWIRANINAPGVARLASTVGLGLVVVFVAGQDGLIDSAVAEFAALSCVAFRAVAVWLVGKEFERVAIAYPALRLLGSVRLVQRLLTLALALWFLAWGVHAANDIAGLGLDADPQFDGLVRITCSTAEWLIISSVVGACLVLDRFHPLAR